ncbi:MAG: HlyD family efflux transporter periplasmic adaptor subunit [Magnetococcales bacterium]|nr:HlyD family efflux transporter periplasmic adaptor subunit [Magnetococcales bacterium]
MNTKAPDTGRPPPLREELHLFPGPRARDGTPTWTLNDPTSTHFYRIGWMEFEIISRWRRGGPDRIAELVNKETPLEASPQDVRKVVNFLLGANLLRPQGQRGLDRLHQKAASLKKGWLHGALGAYLFFRVPILNPDRFLNRIMPMVKWLYSGWFIALTIAAGLMGFNFIIRQWDSALQAFNQTRTLTGLLLIFTAIFLTKAVHEIGHALASKRYGCHIPTIGVAFLMLMPVMYTDVSEVWKLVSKRSRMIVGAIGIIAELGLAAWASLLWGILPPGELKDALFFVACVSWLSTIAINASPFLRFDGYYLLSDWWEIENLHERAGNLGRWQLREFLFGWDAPFPDWALYERRKMIIAFAWLTWVYRFFLFLGIALLVYHFFFKALGMLLMSIEIVWFIVRPIYKEVRIWTQQGANFSLNLRLITTVLVFAGFIALLFVPWKESVKAAAMLVRDQSTVIHAPATGQIVELNTVAGDRVKKGEMLFSLNSPDLDNELKLATLNTDALRWKLNHSGSDSTLLIEAAMNQRELEASLTHEKELLRLKNQMNMTAPFDALVTDVDEEIKPGIWVAAGEPIMEIAHPKRWQIITYVKETDLRRLSEGGSAKFYPEGLDWNPIPCRISSIAMTSSNTITEVALSLDHGGDAPTYVDPMGNYIPNSSIYRVVLDITAHFPNPAHMLRGSVTLEGTYITPISEIIRFGQELWVKETGF